MFQFPALASCQAGWHSFRMSGCPIRKSSDQRLFAPTRSLSQLITSFIASESQGIRHAPLLTFFQTDCSENYPLLKWENIRESTVWYILLALYFYFTFCTSCQRSFLCFQRWWRITDSNRWPSACKADALASWANPPRVIEHRNNVLATTIFVRSSPRQSWTADLYIISVAL